MILSIYGIYDSVAEANLTPFFLPNDNLAMRTFIQCINDSDHAFSKSPFDYTLYKFGDFDNEQSSFEILNPPEVLLQGGMVVNSSPELSPQINEGLN